MKWFKHLSGALNDNMIFEAIEQFGGDGYLVFFGTMEMMADEFDIHNPGVCRLSIRKMTKNFQISRQKLTKILSFFDQKAKEKLTEDKSFFATIDKDHVDLKCSRLAKLCDEHTQKLLVKNRESVGSQSGTTPAVEAEAEAEADLKEEKDLKAKDEDFILPSHEQILYSSGPKIKTDLMKVADELRRENIFPTVYAFVNKSLNDHQNPRAIIHALGKCFLNRPKNPYGYCVKILRVENGNFNEHDART